MAHSLRNFISRFFQWWLRELAAMIPLAWRRRVLSPKPQLRIRLGDHAATLLFSDGREFLPLDTVNTSDRNRNIGEELRESLARAGIVSGTAVIELTEGRFVSLQIKLPAAARDHLDEVLRNEMDRYTPFNHQQVYFDYRIDPNSTQGNTITVEVVLTPRQPIDQWFDLLESLGLRVTGIEPSITGDPMAEYLNLGPRDRLRFDRRKRAFGIACATSFAMALLILGAWLPVGQRLDILQRIETRLEQKRAAANALVETRQDLDVVERAAAKVKEESRTKTPLIVLWAELTRLLPDGTWLEQLNHKGDHVRVVGYSDNASSLIEILEASELLSDVRFDAPVTIDSKTSREHFRIAATLVARS